MANITTAEELRRHYAPAMERAVRKTLQRLDGHCRRFLELSPLALLGTTAPGGADVSPRGDRPGFTHVLDDTTLALPDWPGNNRLDTLENILVNPQVGLLFLVPGVDETLRVNGTAAITVEPDVLARWNVDGRQPKSAVVVTVREAYFHCGKALIRSRLWHADYRVERSALPSYGKMLSDQIGTGQSAEEIEASVRDGYLNRLY